MVRTLAVLVVVGLATACSSPDASAPAPDLTSSAAATTTTSAAPTTAASATADAATVAWAGRFCAAATPLTELGALPQPDTSSPSTTRSSLLTYYRAGAADLTRAATALGQVGPPPVAGAETLTSDAATVLTTSAGQFSTLADQAQAADPADTEAVGTLATGFTDAISALQTAFATLNTTRAPQVSEAIALAPACRALGGGTAAGASG